MNGGDIVLIVAAYFLGAVPFSVLFARAFGLPDPRDFGSGNPGATNIARRHKPAALLTLLADAGKGALPVLFAADATVAAAAGFAAVCGHIFSIFLRLRGGKGVATLLGAFLAWYFPAGVVAGAAWILMFALFRISSAASVTAAAAGAATILFAEIPIAIAGVAAAILVIFRHRRNLADLAHGRENGFGKRARRDWRFVARILVATVSLASVLTILGYVHDYSVTRRQIDLIRTGDTIAVERPWIAVFFFFNEAGSGLKYMLTGNEKHMRHYPTNAYLWEKRLDQMQRNLWRTQERVARRYRADNTAQSRPRALSVMRLAAKNAPAENRARLAAVIRRWEAEDAAALLSPKISPKITPKI